MKKQYNYNHLYYFYITFKVGKVTHACKELGISQATLSAQLKTFQEQMGVKLYEKQGKLLCLSGLGTQLFKKCEEMFSVDMILPKEGVENAEA